MYSVKFVMGFLLLVSCTQTYIVQGIHIDPTRAKRGIFGTVTSTVWKTIEEKHYVPASCVYMEPNLPNCRHVRFLFPNQNGFNFFNVGNELNPTSTDKNTPVTNNIEAARREDVTANSTMYLQGWGAYLGISQPTVTVTNIKIQPTTVLDPRIVITYAVKGCKPHNLPTNLEQCPEEDPLELAEILPTSTVRSRIEATRIPEIISPEGHGDLESAEIEGQGLAGTNRATKSL